ncbi:MAG: hypothetical protein OXH84_07440 [Gammaproteobacteria bacterium]|nr:hypothetical protein [Gammaproteobacteria bacterium]
MQSVTHGTIKAVIGLWFDSNRHERYYRSLRQRYQRWNIYIKFVKIPSAIVAVVLLILLILPEVNVSQTLYVLLDILFVVIYFVVDGIDRLFKVSTRHDVLDTVVSGCSLLHTEVQELWYKIDTTGVFEHEASTQYQKLNRSLNWLLFVPDKFIPMDNYLRDISSTDAQTEITQELTK